MDIHIFIRNTYTCICTYSYTHTDTYTDVDADTDDQILLGHLMLVAGDMARKFGVDEAFRLVVNNGADAGQTLFHLHLHVLAKAKDTAGFSESDITN